MFDSHIFTKCSPFQFFNPLKYLPVQFPSCLLADNTCIHMGPFMCLKYARADFFLYFHLYVLVFVESLCFSFSLVNFESDVYLAVDHSLVYSYPKRRIRSLIFLVSNLIVSNKNILLQLSLAKVFHLMRRLLLSTTYLI